MNPQKPVGARVKISKNGPYLVSGGLPLHKETIGTNEDAESTKWEKGQQYAADEQYALCRCGHSANKPFCDGTHAKVDFDGSETASRQPYLEQAQVIRGPTMSLTDVEGLCAFARFCDPHGQVWNLVNQTDDPSAAKHFVSQTCACPSGRLVAWDNATGKPIEPALEPSIGLIEDPAQNCSGPIWLRGGVQLIGADGFEYEVRNRMTLCRCGESQNKPFCDGTHASMGFSDSE
ncbi:CDGSH iron-sulfur domain-containing protein [Rhodanobacter sp. C05]|uniref:CDGSH iron-sulfur domain-containing protein n=1 Tax=Rhodanobacter sp. C05 TaxID=1945855 RepID=UPI0009860702|nr:CDGSH iron-sulfur domain-containing protein [Rhodanobacter sp. C05]OOG37804.1 iron-binding protein [Rhodanobacter sp. C05]